MALIGASVLFFLLLRERSENGKILLWAGHQGNSRPENIKDRISNCLFRSKSHTGSHLVVKLFVWSWPSYITSGIVTSGIVWTFKRKRAKIKAVLTKKILAITLGIWENHSLPSDAHPEFPLTSILIAHTYPRAGSGP